MRNEPELRAIVTLTPAGLYCPAGDFHVDPWRRVERAVLTHAHSDHARPGSALYHAAAPGLGLLRHRLGHDASIVAHPYGRPFRIGDARVSLHPAGHVLGSAQVRIEVGGAVAVVTGDFKTDPDPSCAAFEPLGCDLLITEATFALPIYRWPHPERVVGDILAWWEEGAAEGRASVLFAYSLGKAQRILAELARICDRPVHVHGAIAALLPAYREAGVVLPGTVPVAEAKGSGDFAGALVLAPPGASGQIWMRRFGDARTAFASGWMQVRGQRRRRGFDRGFVLSDHADWPGLIRTVRASGARRVLATHGHADVLARYLCEQGVDAAPLTTLFGEAEDG